MVQSIIQKANARLTFLFRKQKFINLHTKILLVMSLIRCYIDYACSFCYPGLSKLSRKRLQITQNKMIRFVLKLDSTPYARSFRRRFFAFHYTVTHPHTNIILP